MSGLVLSEVRGSTAIVTLNRPDKRNALSRELIVGLTAAFKQARDDARVRSVVLAAAGPVFCAGMDLTELSAALEADGEEQGVWDDAARLSELYQLIYTLPKPTVAAVNGAAVAGGAGLVTVCDLAVSAPDAQFGYPEVRRGLVAAMVLPHLLRHVGERAARYLLLTGELIPAAKAQYYGLVNAVVAADQVKATALQWCQTLAEGGPQALARTKELFQQMSRQALSVEETAQASAAPRLNEECRQGLQAFFERRPAPWAQRHG